MHGAWPEALTNRAPYAIMSLTLFGSVPAFLCYYYPLRRVDAMTVNLLTRVTPVTALLLGALAERRCALGGACGREPACFCLVWVFTSGSRGAVFSGPGAGR